jgi:hypothetical protein
MERSFVVMSSTEASAARTSGWSSGIFSNLFPAR